MVGVISPAATAAIQRDAVVGTQHEAGVALAALSTGAVTWDWGRGGRRGRAAGWAWWATELVVAVAGAGDFCRWMKEREGEKENGVREWDLRMRWEETETKRDKVTDKEQERQSKRQRQRETKTHRPGKR